MDLTSLLNRISDKMLTDTITSHDANNLSKKLVYTAFDGDYMNFFPHILSIAKTNGFVPLNPESTLGYYVSTMSHGCSKVNVMRDCIKTELMCDEMWIFSPVTGHIPEGVLAEMMVWVKYKETGIRVIPFFDGHKLALNPDAIITDQNSKMLNQEDIKVYISSQKKDDVDQIIEKLLKDDIHLPSSAYVVASFFNYKHLDGVRAFCYLNGYCPVSPQNILPYSLYANISNHSIVTYMEDRLALLDKCEYLIWVTNFSNIDDELKDLDCFSCTELKYFEEKNGLGGMKVIDWKDVEVSKYLSPKNWALTRTEQVKMNEVKLDKAQVIREKIIEYEAIIENKFNIFKGNLLRTEECEMIVTNANAFLFGLISDQSVRAEIAWSLPYRLSQRLGHFDLKRISVMKISEIESALKEKPALHRYPLNIAKYLHGASLLVIEKYDSNAANIWRFGTTAEDVIKRLKEFKGISNKKASLGSLLLVRDLGVSMVDKENINLAYDIHIRRICLRTGLANFDSLDEIIRVGKNIFPEFPGRLTSLLWAIGRDICRPSDPSCQRCPLDSICGHKTSLGGDISV